MAQADGHDGRNSAGSEPPLNLDHGHGTRTKPQQAVPALSGATEFRPLTRNVGHSPVSDPLIYICHDASSLPPRVCLRAVPARSISHTRGLQELRVKRKAERRGAAASGARTTGDTRCFSTLHGSHEAEQTPLCMLCN
jgi:hypothetical protein